MEDSVSWVRRSSNRGCHYCIPILLIEISISCPIHVHNYEYCIHGCSYFAYTLWFIYARVGLTLRYIACLFCLLLMRANCEYKCVEKLNGDLHQPSVIRYASYPLVLDAFISLAYWNGLVYGVTQSVLVHPKPHEVSLRNR